MNQLISIGRRTWLWLSSAVAALLGLLPHVVHHAGPLAGAALFAGVGGSLLFGALGLLLAVPFLIRLRRRFGSWRVPGLALLIFAAVFSLSTFIVGPQITGSGEDQSSTLQQPGTPTPGPADGGHDAHH